MPGIHPTSRRQVRYAFAAERRGEMPKGTAREWAHRWRCWTAPPSLPVPAGCADAMRLLAKLSPKSKVLPIGFARRPKKRHRRAA
jgi:hypothetical protein